MRRPPDAAAPPEGGTVQKAPHHHSERYIAGGTAGVYVVGVVRWAWRLDAAANKVTEWTGRLAAAAVWRDMRRSGEP